uniref:protein KHNYN n=1 Tax=Doryrhamphus excisus TaxID=161450 RepID=UPI0025ADD24B|nr:protein KHNYN [Doryrhamphus excisus]XP_057924333.1 protein KHNYN [Doryrhamphus excisus]XP_057924334.1 protein KHNYN [Doryrhamphus excisus]
MERQAEVEDEFVCAKTLQGALNSQQDTVERIFRVSFIINARDLHQFSTEQMWLRLHGAICDVEAAKLFVTGLINQEEQQELCYPVALNCVFCGARGLFMDCIIKSTSAHIVVGSPGSLLISGLAVPVVQAYSLITDLIERYNGTQAGCLETEDKASDELFDSRRVFKALVEKWEDRHILDLLLLPGSVKEALLDMVKGSGLGANQPALHEVSLPRVTCGDPCATKEDHIKTTQKMEEVLQMKTSMKETKESVQKPPEANNEFTLMLKFFTAMGYAEEIVTRVLSRTGPVEAFQILDLVQREQDCGDMDCQSQRNLPCEMEDEVVEGEAGRDVSREHGEHQEDEDFVLGVVKKAAVSCGYKEHEVTKVYSELPNGSTLQLLLELQKEGGIKKETSKEREAGLKVLMKDEKEKAGMMKSDGPLQNEDRNVSQTYPDWLLSEKVTSNPDPVKGPPMTMYSASSDPSFPDVSSPKPVSPNRSKEARFGELHSLASTSSVVVTGEQRFLEGLRTPFALQLIDKPGNPKLRTIVIDGSNVAMSHGRGHFFSCRGIALAVQHFWDRGHREISTLLPQWRQKNDPRIREQHYLGELHKLGLLSYTPSRMVRGKRICSYDDRQMLQLAQKTDGVIVTNDNLRDLLDESPVWRDIIKKRLLQYTFVGDHFMVPDDPLGRGGPHLDDFLCAEHRTPNPGNHSFAGVATSVPPLISPRSQTEVLDFRDRTLGGPMGAAGGESQDGVAWKGDLKHRTPEDTAKLREHLSQVFMGQSDMVTLVLERYPAETNINVLSEFLLEL